MQALTKVFQDFVVEYGRVRLTVKHAKIENLKLQLNVARVGTSENMKKLRMELDAALRSADATAAALKKAGVKDP